MHSKLMHSGTSSEGLNALADFMVSRNQDIFKNCKREDLKGLTRQDNTGKHVGSISDGYQFLAEALKDHATKVNEYASMSEKMTPDDIRLKVTNSGRHIFSLIFQLSS